MKSNKIIRGYIFSRPFMNERVPQHIQNIIIRDYCVKNNLHFLLSATEYAMDKCHNVLNRLVKNLSNIHGIVAYSLFQLPEDTDLRNNIYKKILSKKKVIYFAVENLSISNKDNCNNVENIWLIKKTLRNCLKRF